MEITYESIYNPVFPSFKEAQGCRFFNSPEQRCTWNLLDFLAIVSLNKSWINKIKCKEHGIQPEQTMFARIHMGVAN